MARKLTQKQKGGLIFGAAALAALLVIGKAEGAFKGFQVKKQPPKMPLPPLGAKTTAPKPEAPTGAIVIQGTPMEAPCDPLRPDLLPACMGCFDMGGGRFITRPLYGATELPEFTKHQIGVSCDYAKAELGDFWILSVLHPFLENERQQGRLATYDHNAGSIAEFLFSDPISFINDMLGTDDGLVSAGAAVYATAFMISGVGLLGGTVLVEGTSIALPVFSKAIVGASLASTLATTAGTTMVSFSEIHDGIENMYQDLHAEELAKPDGPTLWATRDDMRTTLNKLLVSAVEAFLKLTETKTCVWNAGKHPEGGPGYTKDVKLAELPYAHNPAIYGMFQIIFKQILLFQRRDFSYDPEDYT